jgi:Phage regulatory protein CII (CP76)
MESHQVLRKAVEVVGAKKVASELRVSSSLVYKWCEEDTSGARNPLDRLVGIIDTTGSTDPLHWLCKQAQGYFVKDPEVELATFDSQYIGHTQKMLKNFSELLSVMSESMSNDGVIDDAEAKRIRAEWERLKAYSETFVAACEKGLFNRPEAQE